MCMAKTTKSVRMSDKTLVKLNELGVFLNEKILDLN